MSMTPRENFIHFLKNEPHEWVPTSADRLRFTPAAIPDHVARGLVAQQEPFPEENYGGKDMFGCDWVYEPLAHGSIEQGQLLESMDDLLDWKEKIIFPDYDKIIDWEGCAKANAEYLNTDKIILSTLYTGLFERLISFVGFEGAAMTLVDEEFEDAVPELFDALIESYLDYLAHLKKYFNVEYVEFHDDWGTQRSPMFSTDVYEDYIAPALTKLAKGAHELGVYIEQHSCGFIEPMIPMLAETGIDTWNGQPVNDKAALIEEYGDRFNFGYEIAPPFYGDDRMDETLVLAKEAVEKYRDKNVWYVLPWEMSPLAMDKLAAEIKTM